MAVCRWVLVILILLATGVSRAIAAGDPFFLITSSRPNSSVGGSIFRMEPGTYDSHPIPFRTLLYNPVTVEYDPLHNQIYWSEAGYYRRIRRSSLSGANMETVFNTNDSVIAGMAIDAERRLLFYSDNKLDIIGKMDMVYFVPRNIVSIAVDRPRAIVLDTVRQYIYWTDWGLFPKIERADYSGYGRQTLVSRGLGVISALALDLPRDRLYWVDAHTNHVGTSDLLGNNARIILQLRDGVHFFGLAFYEGSLFVTDWQTNAFTSKSRLLRVEMDGRVRTVASASNGRLNDIHAFSTSDGSKVQWMEAAVLLVVIAMVIG